MTQTEDCIQLSGEWKCDKCSSINHFSINTCPSCGTSHSNKWSCPQCTYANQHTLTHCQICQFSNPNIKKTYPKEMEMNECGTKQFSLGLWVFLNISDFVTDMILAIQFVQQSDCPSGKFFGGLLSLCCVIGFSLGILWAMYDYDTTLQNEFYQNAETEKKIKHKICNYKVAKLMIEDIFGLCMAIYSYQYYRNSFALISMLITGATFAYALFMECICKPVKERQWCQCVGCFVVCLACVTCVFCLGLLFAILGWAARQNGDFVAVC